MGNRQQFPHRPKYVPPGLSAVFLTRVCQYRDGGRSENIRVGRRKLRTSNLMKYVLLLNLLQSGEGQLPYLPPLPHLPPALCVLLSCVAFIWQSAKAVRDWRHQIVTTKDQFTFLISLFTIFILTKNSFIHYKT